MKPLFTFISSVPMCFVLIACGGSSSNNPDSTHNTDSNIVPPNVASTPSPTPEAQPTPSLAPSTISYRLDWAAPQQRVDGSPLLNNEITAYVLRWTNTATTQSQKMELEANITRWDLELPLGQYHFEIATKDHQGRLSQFVSPKS
ncbi:hypothetical protein Q4519_05735 [Motilimonas sp. 1_MG-2023]|uniref:hypothetical protein n=1 Tax=Motilimonas sp. 1_MG-2023 TaxID=3062672 RepID=UPI0026E126DB|nr:hypothetical protein [Motilimonas sp. 1_MG-2023]MDO6525180.1 hypothetical protein [Motilimonas sp. 1_MG-2023]